MTRLYALAQQLIESTPSWPSGHSIEIWRNDKVRVNVEAGPTNSGRLDLVLYNSERRREQCGHFNPLKGWVFTLTREAYADWVKRCGGQIKLAQKLCGDCRDENQTVWWDVGTCAGCGSERVSLWGFPTLSEDFDPRPNDTPGLRQEWRERHDRHAQRRHPEQPRYGLQFVSK